MTELHATNGTEIAVGTKLPARHIRPSTIQLFRFSAVTWNAHRIHYDSEYARAEGYPDVLVQSHLHGCYLAHAALAWAGNDAQLRAFRWQNRAIAVPGDVLTITGTVTDLTRRPEEVIVEVHLEERNQDDMICAPAQAVLALPVPSP